MIAENKFSLPHLSAFSTFRSLSHVSFITAALALSACGGGGGGGSDRGSVTVGGTGGSNWTAGVFQPSKNFAARCATPRTGIDAFTGEAYPDQPGSATSENNWLRSWTHELYLWYGEVPDLDPAAYTTANYFPLLKTSAKTTSGNSKDKFHFTYTTAQWRALSQSGVEASYGAQWIITQPLPPRELLIKYTDPNSPAAAASLARGASVIAIDGIDLVNTNVSSQIDAINAAITPDTPGESHTFTVLDQGSSTPRAVTLTSANVTSTPVQNVHTIATGSGAVGYLLFNDHIATSEQQLINAVTALKGGAGITDLVLDIRYNGGGYLDIASELAYMIAGPTATAGKAFETLQFNDQHPTTDPVTGETLAPVPFHSTTQGFTTGLAAGQALPTLNLSRVFVLTSAETCSASESVINSLRGINVSVIQIGATTCGKPYGFYPQDNCGTTYFSIQFKGVNNLGFGDYTDGFAPINTASTQTTTLPGCSVADDFSHALGDAAEGRLAAALNYRNTQACPAASGFSARGLKQQNDTGAELLLTPKSPWHGNRILR
ncbi:MAG: peptidase [Verrucomicrobiaceae bacterium]|nr:peptidase [Verrucomicrobiaceae bacterium]